ncbi:DUF4253 domain-containing protein [Streptomyces sp. NRRL S-378]|uniref:DUF4253 domain-containing protein n=1 Tax=Streptomyces sp. NRRL S-378 TaxID=1463904 RepID=UPI00099BE772
MLRRWHEQWGAEVFLAQGTYLVLVGDRPPLDPRAAAQAATELLGYCDDTVEDPRAAWSVGRCGRCGGTEPRRARGAETG